MDDDNIDDLIDDQIDDPIPGPDSWFGEGEGDLTLPHWTEPGTAEVPIVTAGLADDDLEAWSTLGTGPRWRDGAGDYDDGGDIRFLTPAAPDPLDSVGDTDSRSGEVFFGLDGFPEPLEPEPVRAQQPVPAVRVDQAPLSLPSPDPAYGTPMTKPKDRDLGLAALTGLGLAVIAIAAMFVGELLSLVVVTVILALGAAEFFNAVRRVGYNPATLVGIATTVALVVGTYWRGLVAYPVVLFLAVVFSMLWYLSGVSRDRPVPNLGITMLGVGYVGILGSFAGLLLWSDSIVVSETLVAADGTAAGEFQSLGTGLLFAAVVTTVAYDIGAYFIGRSFGRSKLSTVSPNKTIEGLAGGFVCAVVAAVVVVGLGGIQPWGDNPGGMAEAIILGLVAAVAATLGDLSESLIKRDLGLKDMGTLLPGHGGILDRFDGLLFVMPATWCAAVALGIAEPISLLSA